VATRWTYFFGAGQTEGDPARKDILGGKGASLAAMSRAGLPVPPGFTIATRCCRLFLQGGGRWPEGLEEEVRRGLARLEVAAGRKFGSPDSPLLVSVRSGAPVSMPGMMDTILNCGLWTGMAEAAPGRFWPVYLEFIRAFARTVAGISADDLAEAEKEFCDGHHLKGTPADGDRRRALAACLKRLYAERAGRPFPEDPWQTLVECINAVFRSWNSPRAIAYRQAHGIAEGDGTAVNVQAMFPSQVSGILFTVNPNDMAAEEMIIESSYGLGESVVSGDVHPDRFVVSRRDLSVRQVSLGHMVRLVAARGDDRPIDPDAPSLAADEVRELARIGLDIEKFFGGRPMDIEWGRADGRFALLQARPIRGLEIIEDVEIGLEEQIHRLRKIAGDRPKVWVLHNLAETLRFPMPLTWDVTHRFMSGQGGIGRMYRDFGYRPGQDGFLELICGRIYADPDRAASLFWEGVPLTYDLAEVRRNPKVMESAPTRFDPERVTGRFFLGLPRLVVSMLQASRRMREMRRAAIQRFQKEVLPPYLEWLKEKRGQNLAALGDAEVLADLRERLTRVIDEFGAESLKPGYFGGMALAALRQRLCQLMGQEAGTREALTLTQGLEGDTTVEQNVMLYRVARGTASMADFYSRFGHRAVGEMELATPRWEEDPSYIKQILAVYLDESVPSPEVMHQANAERRREAEANLPETLCQWGGSSLLEEVRADLDDATAMLPYREIGKHYLMMGYQAIRVSLLELARRWGLGRDIFFLRLDELERYPAEREALSAKIAARKIRWQSAKRLEMPEVIDSRELDSLGLPKRHEAAAELPAEPIASGVATGPARVVFEPEQAAGACADYILVCPSTDPAWTALFVHARGLVVEQGGMLSHGAIVARDFGIPAVVCPGATQIIADGQTICVDGNCGRITLLDGQNGAAGQPYNVS
jgi:pyruvate,water dikinase